MMLWSSFHKLGNPWGLGASREFQSIIFFDVNGSQGHKIWLVGGSQDVWRRNWKCRCVGNLMGGWMGESRIGWDGWDEVIDWRRYSIMRSAHHWIMMLSPHWWHCMMDSVRAVHWHVVRDESMWRREDVSSGICFSFGEGLEVANGIHWVLILEKQLWFLDQWRHGLVHCLVSWCMQSIHHCMVCLYWLAELSCFHELGWSRWKPWWCSSHHHCGWCYWWNRVARGPWCWVTASSLLEWRYKNSLVVFSLKQYYGLCRNPTSEVLGMRVGESRWFCDVHGQSHVIHRGRIVYIKEVMTVTLFTMEKGLH